MRAFVTGATGFIGSHLVESLLKEGFDVSCLVRCSSSLRHIEDLNIRNILGDCCNASSLSDAVSNCDYIFHIAGITKAKTEEDFYIGNVLATETLIKTIVKKGSRLKRFLYLSSLSATGPSLNGAPLNEESKPMPVSCYGRSKYEAEKIVYSYKDVIPITIIRPPAVYGPKDKDMLMFFKMVKSGFVPYWGKSFYSFIYVEDLVNGIIKATLSKEAEGMVFFISDGSIYSSDEIIDAISDALNIKPIKVSIPNFIVPLLGAISNLRQKTNIINKDKLKELRFKNWTCDSTKIVKMIDFAPKVKMKEGAKWTADWYRIHKWL